MTGFGDRVSDPLGSGAVLAVALAFYLAACVLLVFTGPTLGALHAFAAFIVLAIVAALNQLLPVLTHAPVARPQAVLAVAAGFALGFALLIGGFYGAPTFFAASIVLAVSALAWVIWNIARLFMGREEMQTRALMACAVLAFAVAAAIGASMAAALGGRGAVSSITLAPLHAAIAVLGFASLLIVGISYRFVPMFAVAHGTAYGRRLVQWFAVAAVVVVTAFVFQPIALRAGLAGLAAAAIVIGRAHVKTLASRLRKRLDVSLRYGSVAWAFGVLALAFAFAATWQPKFWSAALITGVLGWICITILGYAYKVAGFLAWQTAKERDPAAQLPALSGAVNLPVAYSALAMLALGTLAAAIFSIAWPEHVELGCDLYAAGGVCAVTALSRLASLYVFRRSIHGIATTGAAG
ncbi:MAG TPA: hypothetical protein VFH72_10515 [Candidatus Baltobacteraceae bacterium]|nr:hypothetical protein [Candidatus Baltobacteraceae bacterium]